MITSSKAYRILLFSLVWFFSSCSRENQLSEFPEIKRQDELPINIKVALSAASNFDRFQSHLKRSNLRKVAKVVKETITIYDESSKPAYYIFNYENKMGWIIVAAEKKSNQYLHFQMKAPFL